MGLAVSLLVLLTAALWGGTPVAVSYSLDELPVIAVAGMRFALAAGFMLFWCRLEGSGLRLHAGESVPAVVAGVMLFGQILLFTLGVHVSNSSHATLLVNTFIFWVALIEHFVTRNDLLTVRKTTGLLLATSGVVLVLWGTGELEFRLGTTGGPDAPSLTGDLFLLASALVLGIKIVYTRHVVQRMDPGKLILWHDVVGVMLFAAASAILEDVRAEQFTLPAVLGLLYQGVVIGGFCFAVQAWLLRHYSASQVVVFSFATPLFGIVLAALFRQDELSAWLFAAGVCVAVGILIVNRAPQGASQRIDARPAGKVSD